MQKNILTYLIILLVIGITPTLISFRDKKIKPNKSGALTIIIEPCFGDKPLNLTNTAYINASGDSIYIDTFKFYLSNLKLNVANKVVYIESNSYHLIDAEDSASATFTITNIPEGEYNELAFAIGVDSIANVSGALDGDLDPIKGMYWAWNTGYIAAKIEGHSKACKTLHNAFEFHIGGYLPPYTSFRKYTLKLNEVKITANKTTTLILKADVSEWFKTPVVIDVSKTNNIVQPSKQSVTIANNYADMIKFKTVSNP